MVGRPKGLPKTGGRQKGTPNKPTFDLRALVTADGITPLGYMLAVLNSKNASDKDRRCPNSLTGEAVADNARARTPTSP